MPAQRTPDNGHVHPNSWTKDEQNRYEDRTSKLLEGLREDIGALTTRVTLMVGALTIIAFLLPVIAPFVRAFLSIPSGQ